ncbi:DUF2336 domain-containing protein [Litorimonas sp. RW-G-Af-16]|uniref:DUF2336 domain-containing protein n=1 Tax=Litorimonas sp. RW-G-Af-16 TaxID=3241168 RepID=UPI00390C7E40
MTKIAANLLTMLGKKTVRDAVHGQHIETRALAVQKIGRSLRDVTLTDAERELAEKILTLVCRDVSDIVRRALAVTLQNSPNLPRKIALKLINDIDSIAVPILKNSPVITDDDLLLILKSNAAAKVKAVAQRHRLSAHICSAIVSFGDGAAVADLAANDSALIAPDTAAHMAEIYAQDDMIREAALSRQDMPAHVVQKLISAAASSAERKLSQNTELTEFEAADIANRTQQRALISYVGRDWPEKTLISYVETLHAAGGLSEDIIQRAAGVGDMRFVQIAIAKRVGIGIQKAGLMMFDSGPLGLQALCERAGMSEASRGFLSAAIVIYRDFQVSGQNLTDQQIQKIMLERVLTLPIAFSPQIEADFCDKLDSLSHLSSI